MYLYYLENFIYYFGFPLDVIGRVHELGNVQTVKAQGEDRKRVEFRLIDSQ